MKMITKVKKSALSLFLCGAMLFMLCPQVAATESGRCESTEATGLCEHHTAHDNTCGYSEATPCTHEHTEDCYTLAEACTHKHTAECYPADETGDTAAQTAAVEPTACTHVCSEETACITKELNCQHTHDEVCGYSEGTPCGYVCEISNSGTEPESETEPATAPAAYCTCETLCTSDIINADCPVCGAEGADLSACTGTAPESEPASAELAALQSRVDALPTAEEVAQLTAEERQAVYVELTEIADAFEALSDGEWDAMSGTDKLEALSAYFEEYGVNTVADGTSITINASNYSTSAELGTAVTEALNNGYRSLEITGDLTQDQQTAVGTALREWCNYNVASQKYTNENNVGTVTLRLPNTKEIFKGCFGDFYNGYHTICPMALKEIILMSAIKIGDEAFENCRSLVGIAAPYVTSIGYNAFYQCHALENIEYLYNVKTVGTRAFESCINLQSVSFPKATSVGDYAFTGCESLTNVELPEATETGVAAFQACSALATIELPKVTEIKNYTFRDCDKLVSVSLPKVTKIGEEAFYDCPSLTKVLFSSTITSCGSNAFGGTTDPGDIVLYMNSQQKVLTDSDGDGTYTVESGASTVDFDTYAPGTWSGSFASNTGFNGFVAVDGVTQIRTVNGVLQVSYDNGYSWETLDVKSGSDGADGREIELQTTDTYVQWRYTTGDDTEWKNLIALSDLKGADGSDGTNGTDGSEIELQVADGYIQWKYTDATTWTNLLSLSALTGSTGAAGQDGADGVTPQLKIGDDNYWYVSYDNGSNWTSLGVKATGDTGATGAAGADGTDGKDGETPYIGSNGNWWIGTTDTGVKASGSSGSSGTNGADGKDGVTPQLRINSGTYNWEVSYDNGTTWTSLGVKATGANGANGTNGTNGTNGKDGQNGADGKDGVGIQNAEVNEDGNLIITLTDGTVYNAGKVAGTDGVTPQLRISDATNEWEVSYDNGETWTSLGVKATGESRSNGQGSTSGTSRIVYILLIVLLLWCAALTALLLKKKVLVT